GPRQKFLRVGGPVGKVLQGWQVNGIFTYQTGIPMVVAIGNGNLGLIGSHKQMPNVVAGQGPVLFQGWNFDPARDRYLNVNAFSPPAPFTIGNAPAVLPNARDFAVFNEDFSILKRTTITEKRNLEFRAEMFNILNRTRFSTPNSQLDNP